MVAHEQEENHLVSSQEHRQQRIQMENKQQQQTLRVLVQIDEQVRRVRRLVLTSRSSEPGLTMDNVKNVVDELDAAVLSTLKKKKKKKKKRTTVSPPSISSPLPHSLELSVHTDGRHTVSPPTQNRSRQKQLNQHLASPSLLLALGFFVNIKSG